MRGVMQFNGKRLTQALHARCMTQTSLGELIGYSSGTVSKWIKGQQLPEAYALTQMSNVLKFPENWFLKKDLDTGSQVSFFRSNATATQLLQRKAEAHLEITFEASAYLENWVNLPNVFFPKILSREESFLLTPSEIEKIATEYREIWGLGNTPISNLITLLENIGVIVIREDLGATSMDGVSKWILGRPYILISSDKASACRNRFDLAHELAHLILHANLTAEDYKLRYKEIEKEAHHFASCFLCPADGIAFDLHSPTLDSLLVLKRKWKVSVGALIMRGVSLDIISDDLSTRLWRNYSYRKWRMGEPLDDVIQPEKPTLLSKMAKLLISENIFKKSQLKQDLAMIDQDIEILFGLPKGYMSEEFGAVVSLKDYTSRKATNIQYVDDDNKIIQMRRNKEIS
ncbi:MAG: XRE family transcriptional regulator [Acinetobacter sp.]